ncbi:MAG: hypothetical protein FWG66_03600 [Spirochaetes bacterium]|nr:hypothetical protein [Spirochaetota bacterium]
MKKKVFLAGLAVLLLASCRQAEPIASLDFEQTMSANGYRVLDVTHQIAGDHINVILLGISGSETYQFEFYDFVSDAQAQFFFQNMRDDFEANRASPFTQSATSGRNSARFQLTAGGVYVQMLRRANTVIIVQVDEGRRDAVANLIGILDN